MLDKFINFLLGTAEQLKRLDTKTQEELTKYNNKQIKRTAVICFVIGLGTGLVL